MKKLVIFDLDGTILDTLGDLKNSVNYSLKQKGLKEKTTEEIKTYVGNGIEILMRRALPSNISEEEFQESFNVFKTHYEANMQNETAPYDGIIEVMKSLKSQGYLIAVVSNKFQSGVDELVEKFFKDSVDIAVGTSEKIKAKPDPAAIKYVFEKLGIEGTSDIYFIGDSEVDIQTARNANLKVISVSWGFRSKEHLMKFNPDFLIDEVKDILNIIK